MTTGAHDIYMTGLRVYDSAIKEVSVYNLGGCRWGSGDFVVDRYPWNTLPPVSAISPKLVIFQAGIINDWDDAIPLSTLTSHMVAGIHVLYALQCDAVLVGCTPSKARV